MADAEARLRVRLRLGFGDDIAIGPGKAELLEAIRETGSIAAAGRAIGMSYKRAWLLVGTMNRCFADPLVEVARGGQGHGGAKLTTTGVQVLSAYRSIVSEVETGDDYRAIAALLTSEPAATDGEESVLPSRLSPICFTIHIVVGLGGTIVIKARRSWGGFGAVLGLAAALLAPGQTARAQDAVVVFAAASMQTALDAVAVAWEADTGGEIVISYAATSALARQIEQGAPADIFVSADVDWMDYLAERELVDPETRTDLLGNRLVLVAPTGEAQPVAISPELDLAGLLGDGRLAVADTDSVPAGRYARAALETLGLWTGVNDRLAPAANVRAALAFVSRGEAPLGIVYATDDIADPSVEAIGIFPVGSHSPIVYPAAIVADSSNPDAKPFLDWLRSFEARCLFEAEGFTVLAADGSPAPPADCPAG